MSTGDLPQSLLEAQEYAATYGVILTAADYRRIEELKATALVDVSTVQVSLPQRIVERFNRHYPEVLHFLAGVGDTAITAIQTTALALGLPILLVLVLVVEHSRVKFGIGLFEAHNWLANLGGWLLVGTNTVLEFLIYHLEYKYNYQEDRRVRGSLRLYARKIGYWLGIGSSWQEQQLSPAQRYKSLQRIVTAVILVLATAGSMTDVIARQTGTWYEAVTNIVTKSSLSEMSTWIGGLLFAVAAVLIAQVVTQYAALRSREIMTGMNILTQRQTPAQEAEARAVQYILAKVAKKAESTVHSPLSNGRTGSGQGNGYLSAGQDMDGHGQSANGNGHGTGQGYSKRTDARATVWAYLEQNPQDAHGNVRELATFLGVGKSTVSDVQRQFREQQQQMEV